MNDELHKIVLLFDLRNEGPEWVTFVERNEDKDPVLGVTSIPTKAFTRLGQPDEIEITLRKVL